MNGQRQNENAEMDIIYIAGGILLAFGVLAYFFRVEIVRTVLWIKLYELKAITLVLPQYRALIDWVQSVDPGSISLLNIIFLCRQVGEVIRYPMILIGVISAAVLYFFHSDNTYRAIETMESLSEQMKYNFPASQVISGWDLVNTPLDQGPWAMALTPIEFAKKHKLLYRDATNYQVMVDTLKTKLVFRTQLGRIWKGHDELRPHEKAIFGVLAAYINYQRSPAEAALEEISRGVTPDKLKRNKLDYGPALALFSKYKDSSSVSALTQQHGYVLTVLAGMLVEARKTGIVSNSSYLWLKPIDRQLWYVLNNVGRKAVFVETGAVHAHWLVERSLGFAVYQPMVDETLPGLQEAVRSRIIKGEV